MRSWRWGRIPSFSDNPECIPEIDATWRSDQDERCCVLTVLTHKHWLPVRCRRLVPGAVAGHGVRLGGGTIRDVSDRQFVKNKFQLFAEYSKYSECSPCLGGAVSVGCRIHLQGRTGVIRIGWNDQCVSQSVLNCVYIHAPWDFCWFSLICCERVWGGLVLGLLVGLQKEIFSVNRRWQSVFNFSSWSSSLFHERELDNI